MKRQTLVNGLLSLTAVSLMTGCVDDKYDLSDIDTTSKFTVNDLTVPVKLQQIKLENVIDLDDNENIQTIGGKYVISESGSIAETAFKLNSINVNAPHVDPITININTAGLPNVITPALLPEIVLPLPETDKKSYDLSMDNVEKALLVLDNIKTTPITIKVTLSVPSELTTGGNSFAFENLNIKLPWGLITNDTRYSKTDGMVSFGEQVADANGQVVLEVNANGLDLLGKGNVTNGHLGISGEVGVESGSIKLGFARTVTVPSPFEIKMNVDISGFEVTNFSGRIDYKMDNINIAPISLSDLPDFLNDPQTNLIIANPEISVSIKNPVAQYGLVGKGKLTLTSNFGTESKQRSSDDFYIKQNAEDGWCYLTLSKNPTDEATGNYQFYDLGYVLTNHNPNESAEDQAKPGLGLPKSISVAIENLSFAGQVTDFPLTNLGNASGEYSFTAPLGFGDGSKVIYESTESGWGSDDLDKVNINYIHLKAACSTNLPVSVKLEVFPIDKNGREIDVKENSEFIVPAKAQNVEVALNLAGQNGPIKDFDGVRFKATVTQDSENNTEAIGPDLFIVLDDLKVTVDGDYVTDF